MDIEHKLTQLASRYPLPEGYELQEPFIDQLQLGNFLIGMAGLLATKDDIQAETIGAAAGLGEVPIERAYFELLERTYTRLARDSDRTSFAEIDSQGNVVGELLHSEVFGPNQPDGITTHSLTNGVAIQRTPEATCRSALSELAERDHLLRAWYGFTAVTPVAPPTGMLRTWAQEHYEVLACVFSTPSSAHVHSAALLAYPHDAHRAPLLFASGGGSSTDEALARAERELLQRLAFLWGEDIPAQVPKASATVHYHQEYYLVPSNHRLLRDFMLRGHGQYKQPTQLKPFDVRQVRFVDLRMPGFPESLCLVRAVGGDALPVLFGQDQLASALPAPLQVHPIS